jgi:hypothetical protein
MIDIASETILTLSEAAARQACRRQGKRVSTVTIWRWATRGARGIVLESLQTPSGRVTSVQAIQRFFVALSEQGQAAAGLPASNPGRRSPSRRQRDSERAERILIAGERKVGRS